MAVTTGRVYVPVPTPLVPRYGLITAAIGPLDLPRHARNGGLEYEVGVCSLPTGYEVNCQAEHASKPFDGTVTLIEGDPFVIYSSIECGAVGLINMGQERVQRLLYDQLIAGEQATAEAIFSVSDFGQSPGLANNPAVVNLGSAVGIVQGFGMLEDWLYARYGLPGVIHVPMEAASYVKGAHLVERDGPNGKWRTAPQTVVSFGNYAGLGPTGQTPAANTTWIYITGQVAVYRTPDADLFVPPVGQILNRSTNLVNIIMEREYVITFDCHVAAVQVTLDTTDH